MAEALPHSGTSVGVPYLRAAASSRRGRFEGISRDARTRGVALRHRRHGRRRASFRADREPRVEAVYPHDTASLTQGLELRGQTVREHRAHWQIEGAARGRDDGHGREEPGPRFQLVRRRDDPYRSQLIQLTYTTGIAIVYDLDTFAESNGLRTPGKVGVSATTEPIW